MSLSLYTNENEKGKLIFVNFFDFFDLIFQCSIFFAGFQEKKGMKRLLRCSVTIDVRLKMEKE